jgi:deazaflavin-dependent oxidoreductase (nitroreductase family)
MTATPTDRASHAPRWVTVFNPISRPLLAAGLPLGPNGLLTVAGRRSGVSRTTPLAVIEHEGRRWVWSPWGEVNWVRNLRAADTATITVRKRASEVQATELDHAQRLEFFRDVLGPVARTIPLGTTFIRYVDGVNVNDPVEAAEGRPVFELLAADRP